VSLSVVTDPFGDFTDVDLRRCFDVVLPYKEHYVTDVSQPVEQFLPRRHRRNVLKARDRVRVEVCPEPLQMLEPWIRLYDELIERYRISGIRAFSRTAFMKQLAVPGLLMLKASEDDRVVGLHLWFLSGDVAYGHLGGTNARGRELMASYALYEFAIDHFRTRVRWLSLGAGAGVSGTTPGDGLSEFKAGWSTGRRPVFLCGRIFQRDTYARLVKEHGVGTTSYFPAYRLGEFANVGGGTPGADSADAHV
jgi:hypothetical protein